MTITRRDFLNGVAIGVAAGMTPLQLVQASPKLSDRTLVYPPALTGMRGNQAGSPKYAHPLAFGKRKFDTNAVAVSEEYDLVVVGSGISGLAAALFWQRLKGKDQRILILDNHDEFGGHARRNEFTENKRLYLGYGGSESLQSPKSIWSSTALELIKDLGVGVDALGERFQQTFYPDLGLSRGVFFDEQHFGVNRVVAGDPGGQVADEIPRDRRNGRTYAAFIGDFPLSAQDRYDLHRLHAVEGIDYLRGMSVDEKLAWLESHSYEQFLREKVKLSDKAISFFRQITCDFQGVGIDATPAYDARICDLPGLNGMGLPPLDAEYQAELDDPYIYHFPDGNAGLTRLMVRRLIPNVAPGNSMDDVVLARFDYDQLDLPSNKVRLRLNSTCIHAANVAGGVEVSAIRDEQITKVFARKVVMAGYNMMIPFIVPEMSPQQKEALEQNVKLPMVYSKVMIRNWRAFMELGVHCVYCPTAPYSVVKLDYPVDMGGYQHPRNPDEPIMLHMIYVPTEPGLSVREQARKGREKLMDMSFDEHEQIIRQQLQQMLGDKGFQHEKDVLEITVNRWAHGYSYFANTLFDDEDEAERIMETARKPIGNITIANSDSAWDPYAHAAIDQAWRAVNELLKG